MFPSWNCDPETLEPLKEFQPEEQFPEKPFECNRCGNAYRSLKSLNRHRFHCGNIFNNTIGRFGKNSRANDDQAQFQCTYCTRAYRWKKGLKRHQVRCSAKLALEIQNEDVVEINPCENSQEKYPEEPELELIIEDENISEQSQKLTPHNKKQESQEPDEEINIEKISSKSSSSDADSNSDLRRNRNASVGRFTCILCGKRYGWLKNLRRHQIVCRKKVSKQRWKECKVMIEPLKFKSSRKISDQNFKCSTCGQEYRYLKDFRQHQAICYTNIQKNVWNVSDSSSKLNKSPSIRENDQGCSKLEVSIDGESKVFKCAFCSKEYKWRRSLRRHYLKCDVRGELSLTNVSK